MDISMGKMLEADKDAVRYYLNQKIRPVMGGKATDDFVRSLVHGSKSCGNRGCAEMWCDDCAGKPAALLSPSVSESYQGPVDVMEKFENLINSWRTDKSESNTVIRDLQIAFALGQTFRAANPDRCKGDLPHHCSNCDNDI